MLKFFRVFSKIRPLDKYWGVTVFVCEYLAGVFLF